MNKLLLLSLLMFPAIALSADAELKLQLTPTEIDNKELQLEEQLKKQETNRMVKHYPSGSNIKVDRVNPDKIFNKDGLKTYKKNPNAKPDHGLGVTLSVPLTEDK